MHKRTYSPGMTARLQGPVLCLLLGSAVLGADYNVKLRKPQDSVTISERNGRTLLTVVSPSGIGAATISLKDGAWPEKMTVRFLYAQPRNMKQEGFKHLEGISIRADNRSARDLKRHDRTATGQDDAKQGTKEVDLPDRFADTAKTLTIEWIDAYR